MAASIGKIAASAQGVGYLERDGYCATDDGAHREAGAWAGRGRKLCAFPGRRRLGRKEPDGSIGHRPGRNVTPSAPSAGSQDGDASSATTNSASPSLRP